ncbi:MAG: Na(+)/H(+) antiporter subunit D [Halobacteriales archaeon]
MTEASALVPPFVVVLAAAGVLPLLDRRMGHGLGLGAAVIALTQAWVVPEGTHLEVALFGFDVVLFHVDGTARLMGIIFGLLGMAAVTYSWGSAAETTQTAFALGYVGTSLGAVFAGDWLVLVFFWELMALTSTLLVWHHGGEAVRAGFRYALLHGLGGTLLLGAIVWHYAEVGSFLFAAAPGGIADGAPAALAALGIGVNVGFVGLHTWLPDTYPRPHVAASVFLSVYTTKTGVYGMFRAFPEGHLWVAYMGSAMVVFGVTFALLQSDMRRLLSYHIQSQVGYMVAGVGIGASLATAGAFEHVFNHILYKALLFMAVGVVIYRTGVEDLYRLGGLWRQMPLTAGAFAVGALSISGFPGFNGFISKEMVMDGALYAGHEGLWLLMLLGALGTFLSFIKLGYYVFLHGEATADVRDATPGQAVAMVALSALCVLLGLAPDLLHALVPQTPADLHHFGPTQLAKGFGLAGAAVVGFALAKPGLAALGTVRELERVLHPAGFRAGRLVMLAVTEAFATVDGIVAGLAARSYAFGADPVGWLERARERGRLPVQPSDDRSIVLIVRADVGQAVLLLVAVVTLLVAWLRLA